MSHHARYLCIFVLLTILFDACRVHYEKFRSLNHGTIKRVVLNLLKAIYLRLWKIEVWVV